MQFLANAQRDMAFDNTVLASIRNFSELNQSLRVSGSFSELAQNSTFKRHCTGYLELTQRCLSRLGSNWFKIRQISQTP